MSNVRSAPAVASSLSTTAVVGFLVFIEFASGFTQGYYNPLVASIAVDLNVSTADINWFTAVFTLSAAVSVPLLSKLGDKYGHRRVLRYGVVSVFVASLIIAFAPNYPILLIGRIIMAPLSVWLPLEVALIHNRITGDGARRAVGLIVAVLAGGAVVGSLAAGGVSAAVSNLTILLLVPSLVISVAVFAVFFKIPESIKRNSNPIDYLGFAGLAVIIVGLLWGLGQAPKAGFFAPGVIIPIAVSVVVFVFWTMWQKKTTSPAIDLKLVASRSLGPIYIAAFLFGFISFGNQVPLTTFLASDPSSLGYGFALPTSQISFFAASTVAMATIGAMIAAPLARWTSPHKVLILASATGAVSYSLLGLMHQRIWQAALFTFIAWLALGVLAGVTPSLVAELSPPDSTGIAAGLYNTVRTIGGAVAGAAVAFLLAVFVDGATANPTITGYMILWFTSGVTFAVAAGAILFSIGEEKSRR